MLEVESQEDLLRDWIWGVTENKKESRKTPRFWLEELEMGLLFIYIGKSVGEFEGKYL